MWLKVAASNNNPRFVASHYFERVRQVGGIFSLMNFIIGHNKDFTLHLSIGFSRHPGCPSVLRTDAGTENPVLSLVQPILCHLHNDDFIQERSFRYGRSTSNQV